MKPLLSERKHLAAELGADQSPAKLMKRQVAYKVMVGRDWETRWTWGKQPTLRAALDLQAPISEIAVSINGDCPVSIAAQLLRQYSVEIRLPWTSALGVLIAEAVNLAAKELDYEFYALKPLVIDAVAKWQGVQSGWGSDGAFYLSAEGAGTVSFHDPNNEITAAGSWPLPWSGIVRQWWAFDCLADKPIRRALSLATSPRFAKHLAAVQPNLCGPVGQLP